MRNFLFTLVAIAIFGLILFPVWPQALKVVGEENRKQIYVYN